MPGGRHDNFGSTFGRHIPKIPEGKKRPKFGTISNNFQLWLQKSLEGRKSEKQVMNYNLSHGIFRNTTFWPFGNADLTFLQVVQPINCLSSWTCGAGWPHVGLCPIFLVLIYFSEILYWTHTIGKLIYILSDSATQSKGGANSSMPQKQYTALCSGIN